MHPLHRVEHLNRSINQSTKLKTKCETLVISDACTHPASRAEHMHKHVQGMRRGGLFGETVFFPICVAQPASQGAGTPVKAIPTNSLVCSRQASRAARAWKPVAEYPPSYCSTALSLLQQCNTIPNAPRNPRFFQICLYFGQSILRPF